MAIIRELKKAQTLAEQLRAKARKTNVSNPSETKELRDLAEEYALLISAILRDSLEKLAR